LGISFKLLWWCIINIKIWYK